jgi:signal transduction histidine kinase
MAPVAAAEELGGLWLATLQRALGRASHDVKDLLNGVSVNLEVVRSRAARPDAPASAVASFAEAAGQQLERLTTLLEAVLTLGRAEREPADVAATLRHVGALCGASASSADASVVVERDGPDSAATRVPGAAVRLAIAATLLEIVTGTDRSNPASTVRCVLADDGECVIVTIAAAGRRAAMPTSVAEAVRAAGVRWTEAGQGRDFSLAFPRA